VSAQERSFQPGDYVWLGKELDIPGVIEEVIWSRGMEWPVYLVEWWLDGAVCTRRFHADEVTKRKVS